MKKLNIHNKQKLNLILNGVSEFQVTKKSFNINSNNNNIFYVELNFDRYLNKLKQYYPELKFKNIELRRTKKMIRKEKGFPIKGQRTRSNSRNALLLKNKYS